MPKPFTLPTLSPLAINVAVRYHGSLPEHHGLYRVSARVLTSEGARYSLEPIPKFGTHHPLHGVSRTSIDPLTNYS